MPIRDYADEAAMLTDAQQIVNVGASNPSGVALTLAAIIISLRRLGHDPYEHPAVVLTMCQLMQLTGVGLMAPDTYRAANDAAVARTTGAA